MTPVNDAARGSLKKPHICWRTLPRSVSVWTNTFLKFYIWYLNLQLCYW